MKKLLIFAILSIMSHASYSEVISLDCSGYPLQIRTFPNSIRPNVYVNDKNLNRVEDGWTYKLGKFELTNSRIEFIEFMIPPEKHKHDWVHPQTHYKISRLTGSLEMYRKELNGDGAVINEHGYPAEKCISTKQKF